METTRNTYQIKPKSKRGLFSAIIMILSGIILLLCSLFLPFSSAISGIFALVLSAVVLSARNGKAKFEWFSYLLIAYGIFLFIFRVTSINIALLFSATGIVLCLMAFGIITTKLFAFILGIVNIPLSFLYVFQSINFFDNYIKDGNYNGDRATTLLIECIAAISIFLTAIGIVLCISSLVSKTITVQKKAPKEHKAPVAQAYTPTSTTPPTQDGGKKFCVHCGKEIMAQAVICPHCGCAVAPAVEADIPSKGLNIVSFLIPLVGLIVYLTSHDKTPIKARESGKWALIGVAASAIASIVLFALYYFTILSLF